MELRQLGYFVAVAEEGSFTRAGEREHVAQPGVSAQVRKLEAELGQPLLDRTGGAVTLTTAGEAMLPFARATLAGAAAVRTAVEELAGLVRGRVALGVVPSVGPWLIEALATFHREHPGIEIRLVEATSQKLLEDVASGELDVALAGLPGALPPGLQSQTIVDEALVGAVDPTHRLASRRRITIGALAEQILIALPPGTGGRSSLESAFARHGLTPRVAFEAGDPRVLMELARHGLGVAIVPASAPEDLHVLRIQPEMRSRLELVWRAATPPSPATGELIAHARSSLQPAWPTR
jgi:DNA-binding transcriptional LysR family regulator